MFVKKVKLAVLDWCEKCWLLICNVENIGDHECVGFGLFCFVLA